MCQLVSETKRHVSFDWVKIKEDHEFAKGVKLKGPKVLFLNLGDQNRKFVKLGGPKVHFIQNIIKVSKSYAIVLILLLFTAKTYWKWLKNMLKIT